MDWLGFDFPSKIDQPLEFEERGCERVKRISTKIWFSFRLLVLIKTIRTELVRFDSSFYTLPLCINRFESKSLNGASRLSLPPLLSPYTILFVYVLESIHSFIPNFPLQILLLFHFFFHSSSHGGLGSTHDHNTHPIDTLPFSLQFSPISLPNPQMVSDSKDPPPNLRVG